MVNSGLVTLKTDPNRDLIKEEKKSVDCSKSIFLTTQESQNVKTLKGAQQSSAPGPSPLPPPEPCAFHRGSARAQSSYSLPGLLYPSLSPRNESSQKLIKPVFFFILSGQIPADSIFFPQITHLQVLLRLTKNTGLILIRKA